MFRSFRIFALALSFTLSLSSNITQAKPLAYKSQIQNEDLACVDVFYDKASDPFISSFDDSLKAQGHYFGVRVRSFDAYGQGEVQMHQFKEVSSDRCTKIINVSEPYFAQSLVNLSKKAGNKIIFFNRKPDPEALISYNKAWFVGSNSTEIGTIQGKMVVDYFLDHPDFDRNRNGKLDIILFKGSFGNVDTEFRSQTVIEELRRSGIKFERLEVFSCNWSRDQAYQEMMDYIKKNGLKDPDVIISNNDAMALGALKALQMHGYNLGSYCSKIPVFGIDAVPEAISALDSGMIEGTVSHDYRTMALVCLKIQAITDISQENLSKVIGVPVHDSYIMVPSKARTSNSYIFR